MRICPRCPKDKKNTRKDFGKNDANMDRLSTYCKICSKKKLDQWKKENPEKVQISYEKSKIREKEKRLAQKKEKKRLKKNKKRTKEYKRLEKIKREQFLFSNRIRSKEWRDNNKEKIAKNNKKYYQNNKELVSKQNSEYYQSNKETRLQQMSEYQKLNPGKMSAITAKYKASKLDATPEWLTSQNIEDMEQFYVDAKELQWLSEEPLHVDHIIPLQGENVSGLHVPWNLQILPAGLNCSKHNHFDSEEYTRTYFPNLRPNK